MAHFAKINDDNEVLAVLTVDNSVATDEAAGQAHLEANNNWPAEKWIQCSYNTEAGQHLTGGTAFRANYPNIGWKWDATNNIFHAPQPYASWTLNTTTGIWEAPVAKPDTTTTRSDGQVVADTYDWDETNQQWNKTTPTL